VHQITLHNVDICNDIQGISVMNFIFFGQTISPFHEHRVMKFYNGKMWLSECIKKLSA